MHVATKSTQNVPFLFFFCCLVVFFLYFSFSSGLRRTAASRSSRSCAKIKRRLLHQLDQSRSPTSDDFLSGWRLSFLLCVSSHAPVQQQLLSPGRRRARRSEEHVAWFPSLRDGRREDSPCLLACCCQQDEEPWIRLAVVLPFPCLSPVCIALPILTTPLSMPA
jgi:hypothetical protein